MEILFDRRASDKIREMNPTGFKTEKGGLLLGNLFEEYILLTEITDPSPKDKASRSSFLRNKNTAQKDINHLWLISKGRINYVGEWHTHFENSPIPSHIDQKMIDDMLRTSKMEIDFLILMIIGFKHTWVGIQKKNDKLRRKLVIDFTKRPFKIV